jgi:hypothetical protein
LGNFFGKYVFIKTLVLFGLLVSIVLGCVELKADVNICDSFNLLQLNLFRAFLGKFEIFAGLRPSGRNFNDLRRR